MKTKHFFPIAILVALSLLTNAQNTIVVDHNGTPAVFTTLSSAITAAQSGDYIYISGGVFSGGVTISKELHIIGAGHYPDSTVATGRTQIDGGINLSTGSDNSSLEGFYLNSGNITFNVNLNNITIKRCNFEILNIGATPNTSDFLTVSECVINNYIVDSYGSHNYFEKNIVGYISDCHYAVFSNNIITTYYHQSGGLYYPIYVCNYCTFQNNIFLNIQPSYGYASTYCNYSNNIFCTGFAPPASNYGSNNITGQSLTTIFISCSSYSFNYTNNYHLKSTCLGVGAGTDGTDIGIYGTDAPYKEGAVPSNPHIRYKLISKEDNLIHVNVKVGAQDR